MSLFTWIKSLFSSASEAPAISTPSGPLGISIGRIIKFDEILLESLKSSIKMPIPKDLEQAVYAVGEIDIGHGTKLHRFYFDDSNTWLQITTNGTDENSVENITLFFYVNAENPTSEAEVARLAGINSPVGLPTFTYDGATYHREWGTGNGQTNLIGFEESVVNEADEKYSLKLSSMLYKRDIPDTERTEMVIVSVEESEEGITVSTAVGISLLKSDISIS
jgi:hypothetical protein